MTKRSLTVVLFMCILHLSTSDLLNEPYCFKFRWLEPLFNNERSKNCTNLKGVPCIEPSIQTATSVPPNTTDIWNKRNETLLCLLTPGNACIQYSFHYNGAIVNTSHYCGKMIEDETKAVTSKCFEREVDGYTIVACACRSQKGFIPCNSSVKLKYSTILSSISILILLITFQYY